MNGLFSKLIVWLAVLLFLHVVNYYTAPTNSNIRKTQMLEHAQFADGKATDILSLNSDFFEGEIREGRYRILNVEQSTFSGADNVFPATIVRLQGDDGVSVELIGSAAVTNHLSPGDWVVVREGHIERR